MLSQEEVNEMLKEKDSVIDTLRDSNSDLQRESEDKDIEIESLSNKTSTLEERIRELESADADLESVSQEELVAELLRTSGALQTMNNSRKIELFFQNIESFSEEQFEQFLKSKGAVLMYGK